MVKLRVVGSSADKSELILSARSKGRRGTHTVAIDRRLLGVLQKAVYARREAERREDEPEETNPRFTPTSVEPPKVPPREIQRLLRAGLTVEQVGRATDLDTAYIEQFVTPVLYEREGIVRDARNLSTEKARLGVSALTLGESVEQNLAQRRVRMTDEQMSNAWSATRQEGEPWTIAFSFPFRGRTRRATWRYDPRSRKIAPANKLGHDMGWVSPTATRLPVTRPVPVVAAPRRRPSGTGARRRPSVRKAAPRKPAARRKAAPKRKPAARRKTAPKRKTAARRKAAPKRKTALKRKPATRRKPAARRKTVARRKPAARRKTVARRKPAARRKTAPRRKTTARRKPARKAAPRRKTAARRKPASRRR